MLISTCHSVLTTETSKNCNMKQFTTLFANGFIFILLLASKCISKPSGEYSTLSNTDYGETDVISGTYSQSLAQAAPQVSSVTTGKGELKQASSFDIGYGAPFEPFAPQIIPLGKFGGWGGGFGGWKTPQPIFAPIPIIAKPISIPISVPFGWGWPSPGLFR